MEAQRVSPTGRVPTGKLLELAAIKLYIGFTRQNQQTPDWAALSADERRLWMSLAKRAAGLFASDTFAPLVEVMRTQAATKKEAP